MPAIKKSALLPYTSAQMYALVDDVNSYADFLPWCGASEELERTEEEVRASITIDHKGIKKTFTTRNRHQRNKIIEMRLIEGPFRVLEGFWHFEDLGANGCKVSLDLEFEFASKLIALAVGPVFNQIASNLVDAFCSRARDTYG